MIPKLLIKQNEMLDVEKKLEEFYSCPHKLYGAECTQSSYNEYCALIDRFVKNRSKILDIGSGNVLLPLSITKKGFRVFSCDFFPVSKMSVQKEIDGNNNPCFIRGNGKSLPFKSETFDAVTSLCVLEHIVFVAEFLREADRVLKKGGMLLIKCPNWAGFNAPIRAIVSLVFKRKRYWQYQRIVDALSALMRSFVWALRLTFSKNAGFVLVYPIIKNGKVDFRDSDDDCVHLCHPVSFRKWLKENNYRIISFNKYGGRTAASRLFNILFPSFASENNIVAQKE